MHNAQWQNAECTNTARTASTTVQPRTRVSALESRDCVASQPVHSVLHSAFCILHSSFASCPRQLLFEQLLPVQLRVEPAGGHERVVRAALGDAAALEHEDLVGVAHGGDPVRHDDRRCAASSRRAAATGSPPPCRCPPPTAHRRGSGCAGRARRPRERRALLLAARQRDAALPHRRGVALREVGDVLVEPRDGGGRLHGTLAVLAAGSDGDRRRRTRRCRRACRRRGTAPAGRSRSRRAASASGMSRTSMPSMNTVPGGGSCSRGSRLISVDLPEPVAPTSATVWPGSMTAEMPSSTRRPS